MCQYSSVRTFITFSSTQTNQSRCGAIVSHVRMINNPQQPTKFLLMSWSYPATPHIYTWFKPCPIFADRELTPSRHQWPKQRNFNVRSAINELCYFLLTAGGVYEKAPRIPKRDLFVSSLSPSSLVAGPSATLSTSLTIGCQEDFRHVTSQHRRIAPLTCIDRPAAHGHNNRNNAHSFRPANMHIQRDNRQ